MRRLLLLTILIAGCSENPPNAIRRQVVGSEPGQPSKIAGQFDGFYSNGDSWLRLDGGENAAFIRIDEGDFRFKVRVRNEGYLGGKLTGTTAPDSTTTTASLLAIYDPSVSAFYVSMQYADLANPDGTYMLTTLWKQGTEKTNSGSSIPGAKTLASPLVARSR